MTSSPQDAYVWIWLTDQSSPVVCGRLERQGGQLLFNYGQTYLAKEDAVPLYGPELPLQPGRIDLLPRLDMPNCIRDSSPDAWGRRVIINQLGEGQRGARD